MPAVGALVLLLAAPFVARDPVGQGAWHKNADPLFHRVSSLLAGEPVREGSITLVPLYARVPSEAGHKQKGPSWLGGDLEGKLIAEDGRIYLRVLNHGDRASLIPAGAVFRTNNHEVIAARDAVVPADFAVLVPVMPWSNPGAGADGFVPDGVVTPLGSAALLHGAAHLPAAVASGWRRFGAKSYGALQRRPEIQNRLNRMRKRTSDMLAAFDRTVVGAVFLTNGQPIAAHVFATHELFAAALPDLLLGVSVQAQQLASHGQDVVGASAFSGDDRGRAIAFLRNAIRAPATRAESYGEGFEYLSLNERDAVVGHAVTDHRNVPLHIGYFVLGGYWPASPNGANRGNGARPGRRGGVPPRPPSTGGSETPPGVVDRKARPSLSEARQRARRPGPPSNGGGPGGGGGGGTRGRDR